MNRVGKHRSAAVFRVVIAVATVGLALTACARAKHPAAVAVAPPPVMHPACAPPRVELLGSTGGAVTTLSTGVGKPVSITVRITNSGGADLLSATLIVARPGSEAQGDTASPAADSADLPANQVATVAIAPKSTITTASLSFTPPASGAFPLVVTGKYVERVGCAATADARTDQAGTMSFELEVGTITTS